ncbi:MAG: Ig-like domain-containing protein [Chitinophagales bacterium]
MKRQLFNTLITGKNYSVNAVKIFLFTMLFCGMSNAVFANITVTTATGGTNICSNLALDGTTPGWTTLGVITLTEGVATDFGNVGGGWNVSITLNAPAGWQFNTAAAPTLAHSGGPADVTGVTQFSFTATALTITIAGTNRVNIDAVTITGLQVRANNTYTAPGNITGTLNFGTATGFTTGTNLGSLSLNPAPITGGTTVCIAGTTNLSDPTAGGAWSSSNTTLATVAGGVVTGAAAGVVLIDYTVTGCITTHSMTVNTAPTAISGIISVCAGFTTTLSDQIAGGRWSSATSSVATITPATGIVSGTTPGTSVITYSVSACPAATATYTVNAVPAIGGPATLCIGGTITLSNNLAGGTWSSATSAVATVVAATGAVSASSAGTSVITYAITATGCLKTTTVTVNAPPSAISGIISVCAGFTTTLSDQIAGGRWSSATSSVATIGSASGVVSGTIPGTTVITYSVSACPAATATYTVNAVPLIGGPATLCIGGTITLSNNLAGGTWSSATSAVATVVAATGAVSASTAGTSVIKYTITATGCLKTTTVTVNAPPTAMGGPVGVCTGATITLSNSVAGGAWSSATSSVATVTPVTGIVGGGLAGSSVISYSVTACPAAVITVTVTTSPGPISGATKVCQNSSIVLSDNVPPGGIWTSSNTNIATVTGSPGFATVTGAGTAGPVNIIYSDGTCSTIHTVTVNVTPVPITGNTTLCTGTITNLSDAPVGGVWSSATSSVATVGSASGIVSGSTAGTSVITYKMATGCLRTTTVTVNQSPGPISGTMNVCQTQVTILSDGTAGGTWSSGNTAVATVGSASGDVSGVTPGIVTITYQEPIAGCIATATVTVNAIPSGINGITTVCQGATTPLSDTSPGGTWSSDNTSVATVGSATGIVSGVTAGTANITYAFGATCYVTTTLTVNPLPVPGVITGSDSVCLSSPTTLSESVSGGVWSSSNTAIATVSASGVVTGVTTGAFNTIYTVTNGCGSQFTSYAMTVYNLVPGVTITANPGLTSCLGSPVTFTATPVNGGSLPAYQWKVNGVVSSVTNPFTYTPLNGDIIVCRMTSNAVCVSPTMAYDTVTMAVNPNVTPSVSISTGVVGDTVCVFTPTTFTATTVNGGAAPIYQWYVNSSLSGITNPFSYSPVNGDIVSCQLTSSYACAVPAAVWSNSITMTVDNPGTEMPVVTITASSNPSCKGSPVTFTAHTIYGGVPPFIRWSQNNINVATGLTYTIIPNNGDQFYCMLKSNSTCRVAGTDSVFSSTIIETVDSPIAPVVTVLATRTTIITGQVDTLIAVVTPVTITPTYQWYLNGVAIPGATSSYYVINFSAAGVNYYYCIAGNGNACNTSTISNLVTIHITVGVNEVSPGDYDLKLVPNPNTGRFTIEGALSSDNGDVKIQITDIIGQVVYKDIAPVQNGKLNTQINLGNELANGVYLLHVMTNNAHKVIRFTLSR